MTMKRLLFFNKFKDDLDTEKPQSSNQKQKNLHSPVPSSSTWRHRFTSGKVGGRGASRRSSTKTNSVLVTPTVVGSLPLTRIHQSTDEKTVLEEDDYRRHRMTGNTTTNTTPIQSYNLHYDDDSNGEELLTTPSPRRPFSCSAINMPEILHVLRTQAFEDTPSLRGMAPSSKFEYSSIKEKKAARSKSNDLQAPGFQQSNSSSNQSQCSSRQSKATTTTTTGEEKDATPSETITQLLVEKTVSEMKLAQSVTQLDQAMQEIKRLKHQICHLSDNDLMVFRLQTRAQLGLIEYLEGEDDIVAALERFKRQLETSHHPSARNSD